MRCVVGFLQNCQQDCVVDGITPERRLDVGDEGYCVWAVAPNPFDEQCHGCVDANCQRKVADAQAWVGEHAGEVVDGEHVIAKGKVEKVITEGKEDYFRLVVGTTREAIDEYLKLKIPPAWNNCLRK